jgi:hypothetical protein
MIEQLIVSVEEAMRAKGFRIGEYHEIPFSRFQKRWDRLVQRAEAMAGTDASDRCSLQRIPIQDINASFFLKHVVQSVPVIFTGTTRLCSILLTVFPSIKD